MKSVMTKDFSRVAQTEISRSVFDRKKGVKTAFDAGYLVPIDVQEVLPSDTCEMHAKFLARLAPVVTPVMDNVYLDLHAFFVPSRLVWNNWVKMMGERVNPKDSIDYLTPQITLTEKDMKPDGLPSYFGIPEPMGSINPDTGVNVPFDGYSFDVNVLPFRAYQKIWDDWYRDENLQDSVIQSSDELNDAIVDHDKWLVLRKRGKRHDYFTSALPTPQKGDAVNLPLGQVAPVYGNGKTLALTDGSTPRMLVERNSGGSEAYVSNSSQTNLGTTVSLVAPANGFKGLGLVTTGNSGLVADLSDATAATVASLRMAFQIQRMLEKDNRSGTRYVEVIRSHFLTICPDARLQRSEFLGSSSTPINFSPVVQNSATGTGDTPQGNLAATAHAFGELNFTRSFSEHGFIIVLASVRCDLNYQQGLDRLWSRRGRYDYYWPSLAHLSEQAVLNKEIYLQAEPEDEDVFGYQERYAEYRYNPSKITGKMRSGVSGSLDVWHLAQYFDSLPKLSSSFIEEDPPLDRVLAVTEGEPQVICDFLLDQKWTRPMPVYSIPGLIDHL